MMEVAGHREVNTGAERTWRLLSDWGDTAWLPVSGKTEVLETPEGLLRRFHIPGAEPLDEILLSAEAATKTLHYRILPCAIMPLRDYTGTVTVRPLGDHRCRVDWQCRFAEPDADADAARERAAANLERLLGYLAQHLERLRVVQWATGRVGCASLRALIQLPDFELAGLYVHGADKVGRDAGELCGLAPVGIAATNRIEDVLALAPDCVLYMREGYDQNELCRLLEAGINVVTTRGEFFNPARMDPALREAIESACARGGAALHATGVSPGFATEALPLALLSVASRLDCLTIDEYANITDSCSPDMVLQVMGYGRPLDSEFDPGLLAHMAQCFEQSLALVAEAVGVELEAVETSGECAAARSRIDLGDGAAIEAGTVAVQRITVAGLRGGRQVLRFRANWYCSTDIDADWQLEKDGWRVLVEGDAPLDVRIGFPSTGADHAEQMAGYTAHRAVNAVAATCAAAPGIRTALDLPVVFSRLR